MAQQDVSFRLVADSAPVPMWVTHSDRSRLFVNRAYVEFLGCSYDAAVDFDWRTIIHPDDADRILQQSIIGESSGEPFTLEARYKRGDGAWRWISSISNPRWDADGAHCGFIGVAHDITAAKTAQIAVLEREAELSAMVHQSAAGFAQTDLDGKFRTVSDQFCTIWGWSRDALMTMKISDITHPDDRVSSVTNFEATISEGKSFTNEMRYIRPDGCVVWTNNSATMIRDESGDPYRILTVSLDVTSKRKSEIVLKRTSESMRLAIEGAGMATWELNLQTMEGPWSQNRFEMLGYPVFDTGRASYADWLERVHPDDIDRADAGARRCFCDGTPFEIEYRILRADTGEERWLRSNGSLIPASTGQAARFVGISFDITDRKRAEVRQQLLIDELNHRVNNTLSIVQSIARHSIKPSSSASEIADAFDGRLTALSSIHNLLTTGLWQAISLRQLVNTSLKPLAREAQVQAKGPRVMLGTRTAVTFALALHELAVNALKYGALSVPTGRVKIEWTFSDARNLHLSWVEQGGPNVKAPTQIGFGTRLIEKGLAAEFRGHVETIFDPKGLIFRLAAQLPESDD